MKWSSHRASCLPPRETSHHVRSRVHPPVQHDCVLASAPDQHDMEHWLSTAPRPAEEPAEPQRHQRRLRKAGRQPQPAPQSAGPRHLPTASATSQYVEVMRWSLPGWLAIAPHHHVVGLDVHQGRLHAVQAAAVLHHLQQQNQPGSRRLRREGLGVGGESSSACRQSSSQKGPARRLSSF